MTHQSKTMYYYCYISYFYKLVFDIQENILSNRVLTSQTLLALSKLCNSLSQHLGQVINIQESICFKIRMQNSNPDLKPHLKYGQLPEIPFLQKVMVSNGEEGLAAVCVRHLHCPCCCTSFTPWSQICNLDKTRCSQGVNNKEHTSTFCQNILKYVKSLLFN